ncbi:MAG: hypothetical protein WCJ30_22225 [Deltaproteobacteria bacterium]
MRALPLAQARAIDPHGHIHALRSGAVLDETSGTPAVVLPRMTPPCSAAYDHLAFAPDGSAVAISHGRVYVRAPRATVWTGTPACSDVPGEPWARRAASPGWVVVGRRQPGRDPALLMTDDPTGSTGWFATTALDPTLTAISLEPGGSFVTLTSGGHAILVDRERLVAGAVLVASDVLWDGITRTDAGLAMWHDHGASERDVVVGTTVTARFDRQHRARPVGPRTLRVFAMEYGRLVAVTDRGVEWGAAGDSPFVEVARWPEGAATHTGEAVLGWVSEAPALVTPDAMVARRCDR